MGKRQKPPFKWTVRHAEPDDPMFGQLHVAAIQLPKPATDDRSAAERDEERKGGGEM